MSSSKSEFHGIVEKGVQKGSAIGYPTINLRVIDINKDIEFGVYVCNVSIEGENYEAVMHYGSKSIGTIDKRKIFCEIHIFKFDKNVYGASTRVKLLKKIRDVRQFRSEKDLIKQIKSDILVAHKYFKNYAQ
ncbi:riboflavin kinase [bacterium]|nr:riboflavin kinase [bacterium]